MARPPCVVRESDGYTHTYAKTGGLVLLFSENLGLEVQEPLNGTTPIPQPVPDSLSEEAVESGDELMLQRRKGQTVHKDEDAADFTRFPIWLLIKPDGIQFLQTQEEIATNQNAIPANAFLLGCVTVNFKGAAGEQKPDFQLSCQDFVMVGRYGTKQNLDVKGASLSFSTQSQRIQLKGTDELPLEYHSVDAASETRMRAEEITLQLDSGPKTITRFEPRTYVDAKTGQQKTAHVRVAEQVADGNSFQLSAQNITSLETTAIPELNAGLTSEGDAPMWDPRAAPKPRDDNNIPFYDEPSESSNKNYQRRNNPGFQPPPDARQPPN